MDTVDTMDTDPQKLELFEALLSRKGLQNLVDVAARILGNPVIVADMGLNILATGGAAERFGGGDRPDERLGGLHETFKDVARAGDFKRVYATDSTVSGTYPSSPYEFIAARVRTGQGTVGHVVAVGRDRAFTNDDRALLPAICRVVAFEISERAHAGHEAAVYEPLLVELLRGGTLSEPLARARAEQVGLRVPVRYRVVVVEPTGDGGRISAHYLRDQLLRAFPLSFGIESGEENIHVVDGALDRAGIEERLGGKVSLEGSVCGVSETSEAFSKLSVAYDQAKAALRFKPRSGVAASSSGSAAVRFHTDVFCRHLLEQASKVCDPALFATPELELLRACDVRDGTDRVADLEAYLFCGRNIARAAEALHVHKNSMYYRLSRIEEITGLDVHDERVCFRLQLALALSGT